MNKPYSSMCGLFAVTTISGFILISSTSSATSTNDFVVDEINITVPISCSLTGTGMNTHNAEIPNGTYRQDIGTTTLKAFCNDNEGFAIYAAGYTGNEIGGTNSNKLVGTNASSNATIVTGTATSAGNPDISNWAMKLTLGTDSGDTTGTNALTIDSAPNVDLPSTAEQSTPTASFSSYHVVPNEYVKVAHKNSATSMDETTGGVTLTTTYAAYISKTQTADTYSGQVIYTLVHPADHAAPVACNPNGTTISTIACMQDISPTNKSSVINSMILEQQYTLKDKRDGKEYKIAKLADGKVWMTQNLDLDLDSGTTYTNLDTDLGWNGTSYDTASWTPTRSTYETTTNNIHQWCAGGTWDSQYGYCGNNNTPESYDPGDLYWNTEISNFTDWEAYYNSCDRSANTPSCNESLNPLSTYTTISGTPTPQFHLGNYYNWAAAIASNDTSAYGVYNSTTGKYENLESNQSICPTNWTLPYSNWNDSLSQYESDFANLWTTYGWTQNNGFGDISTIWSSPLYFTPGGYFYGNLLYAGHNGYFWSSVVYDHDDARTAIFDTDGDTDPAYNDFFRDNGFPIRCILR